ncbi:other/FunK1 protein kinase [Coprinopsis cinerea okayama7|uniref:Other/FunK1 protein kinase n=1 Tax=Coprinopsis cinerea (strain Okayama-7 / 130 / ATCC MYA-4618 / FGSC 9003) TaxID=240176 RepID=A8PES3_COPC7|nr:other/FunK1 protein kinase [Coprinopsis cinerea okayama7\|eukprot:XP_001840833.2 other/FunK1 protein kinase [Coprinopsis cinerea okayama7\
MIKNDDTRIRRRIVLKENSCTTFYKVPSLKVACKIGKDIVKGLNLLREAGLIHRDISGDNCLIYFDEESESYYGKIADLEYCKEYRKVGATSHNSDPILGTKEFTAVEVEKQFFLAPSSLLPLETEFHRHYLHDLESLYWLMVWCAFVLVHDDIQQVDVEMWEKAFFDLFPGVQGTSMKSSPGKLETICFPYAPLNALNRCGGRDEDTLTVLEDLFNLANDLRSEYTRLQTIPQDAHAHQSISQDSRLQKLIYPQDTQLHKSIHPQDTQRPQVASSGTRCRWAQEHFRPDIYHKFSNVLETVSNRLSEPDQVSMSMWKLYWEMEMERERVSERATGSHA